MLSFGGEYTEKGQPVPINGLLAAHVWIFESTCDSPFIRLHGLGHAYVSSRYPLTADIARHKVWRPCRARGLCEGNFSQSALI